MSFGNMSTRTACVTLCPAKRYSRESVPAPAPAVAILSCRIRFLQGPFQIGYWSIQFRALASDGDDSICIAAASQDETAEYDRSLLFRKQPDNNEGKYVRTNVSDVQ